MEGKGKRKKEGGVGKGIEMRKHPLCVQLCMYMCEGIK